MYDLVTIFLIVLGLFFVGLESQFLGRGPRVPKERRVWNTKEEKGQTYYFFPLHSLGLYNNDVSCLRTVSGLNLLANSVILKCKLWE